jgi:hypothetical protein
MNRNPAQYLNDSTLIQQAITRLEEKVDTLLQDRVTRGDFDKLRTEMHATFVPLASYEPRHTALITRDTQIEDRVKAVEADLKQHKKETEEAFDNQTNAVIGSEDRKWLRISQIIGFAAAAFAILDMLTQHIRFY